MTKLSVNINKVATLRNARGGNLPDVQRFAVDCELFGAQGITVHPRPDERHIRKEDVYQLKSMVTTELNVEGNPTEEFLALVSDIRPTQVTLVPDDPNQLTSNHGWDTRRHLDFLKGVVNQLHAYTAWNCTQVRTPSCLRPIRSVLSRNIDLQQRKRTSWVSV